MTETSDHKSEFADWHPESWWHIPQGREVGQTDYKLLPRFRGGVMKMSKSPENMEKFLAKKLAR